MTNTPHRPTAIEMMAKIEGRLSVIENKLDAVNDHEIRIRALERHRYQTAWLTTIGTAILTTVLVALITQNI
jgi:uncharacterized membrane protein